jgi:ParB-like chromosome segregation protein Spo0J
MQSVLSIRRVPLDTLVLDPANARQHGEPNLDAIRASLTRFGQAEPLVVQRATRRVIGGNGRLVAMRALGWTESRISPFVFNRGFRRATFFPRRSTAGRSP